MKIFRQMDVGILVPSSPYSRTKPPHDSCNMIYHSRERQGPEIRRPMEESHQWIPFSNKTHGQAGAINTHFGIWEVQQNPTIAHSKGLVSYTIRYCFFFFFFFFFASAKDLGFNLKSFDGISLQVRTMKQGFTLLQSSGSWSWAAVRFPKIFE